jgi:hypothetical protein
MPYIPIDRREALERAGLADLCAHLRQHDLTGRTPLLAYALYRLLKAAGVPRFDAPTFADMATVIGVAVSTVMEYYRRELAPYEERKIIQHGDIPNT